MYSIKSPTITLLNNSTIESISKSDIIEYILLFSKFVINNNVQLLLVSNAYKRKGEKGLNNEWREMV